MQKPTKPVPNDDKGRSFFTDLLGRTWWGWWPQPVPVKKQLAELRAKLTAKK